MIGNTFQAFERAANARFTVSTNTTGNRGTLRFGDRVRLRAGRRLAILVSSALLRPRSAAFTNATLGSRTARETHHANIFFDDPSTAEQGQNLSATAFFALNSTVETTTHSELPPSVTFRESCGLHLAAIHGIELDDLDGAAPSSLGQWPIDRLCHQRVIRGPAQLACEAAMVVVWCQDEDLAVGGGLGGLEQQLQRGLEEGV